MGKFGIYHVVQTLQQAFVHEGVEELHLLGSIFQHIADDVFQHGLRQDHVILEISEGNLRLDHPELRRMAGGVGIFRPEGGSEGVNVAECLGIGFAVELSAHRQIGGLSEEVFGEIHLSLVGFGNIVQIHGGHLEHFSRALAVTAGDQRGMHIHKSSLLEKFVDGVGDQGTHPEHRLEGVGSGPQVGHCPQILHGMTFLLQRIIRSGSPFHIHLHRLNLKRLLCLGRSHQGTPHHNGGSHVQPGYLVKVFHGVMVYNLQGFKKGSIVENNKTEGL